MNFFWWPGFQVHVVTVCVKGLLCEISQRTHPLERGLSLNNHIPPRYSLRSISALKVLDKNNKNPHGHLDLLLCITNSSTMKLIPRHNTILVIHQHRLWTKLLRQQCDKTQNTKALTFPHKSSECKRLPHNRSFKPQLAKHWITLHVQNLKWNLLYMQSHVFYFHNWLWFCCIQIVITLQRHSSAANSVLWRSMFGLHLEKFASEMRNGMEFITHKCKINLRILIHRIRIRYLSILVSSHLYQIAILMQYKSYSV